MKKCQECGAALEDDAGVCHECGAPQQEYQNDTIGSPKTNDSFEKPSNAVKKPDTFESTYKVIISGLALVCALVVALVALLAPIKVSYYNAPISEHDGDEVTYTYCEVNQSIFQIVMALTYIKASNERKTEILGEISKVSASINKQISDWMQKHPKATEDEISEARAEITADGLSKVNYLGYVLASSDVGDVVLGWFIDAIVTAIVGAIIAVIAVIMAIMSLVCIIKTTLGLIRKKTQDPFKYLTKMLSMSVYGLTLMVGAPMLKAGGNMFAVSMFVAIAMVLMATANGVILGKTDIIVLAKRAAIAILSMVALFALCSDVFSIVSTTGKPTITNLVPAGFGLHGMVSSLQFGGALSMSAVLASSLIGLIMYLLVTGVVGNIGQVMKRSILNLAGTDSKKTSITGCAIAAVVCAALAIVFGFMSDTITGWLFTMFDLPKVEAAAKWFARAQVWVSAIIMILIVAADKLFNPGKVKKSAKSKKA